MKIIQVEQVAAGVYRVALAWGNAYLLPCGANTLLIDCGLQRDHDDLQSAIAALGIPRISSLLMTHGHCDHAGSAAALLRTYPELRTFAHPLEWPYLTHPVRTYSPAGLSALRRPLSALAFCVGERRFPVERVRVGRALSDGAMVESPIGRLEAVHTPGHTPGHLAYWCAERSLLFSGDAILNIIPFRRTEDLSLPIRALSSDWAQTKCSAQRLANLEPDYLLPGHGRPLRERTAARIKQWAAGL